MLNGFTKTKAVAYAINGMGVAVAAWLVFHAYPYNWIGILCFIFPFLVLAIYGLANGRFVLIMGNDDNTPWLFGAVFIPIVFGIFLRSLADHDLLNSLPLLKGFAVVVVLYFGSYLLISKRIKPNNEDRKTSIWVMIILTVMYGYSASLFYNGYGDIPVADTYRTVVCGKHTIDKSSSHGHSRPYYYLCLRRWGAEEENQDNEVFATVYNAVDLGDTVTIQLYKGRLGATWFVVKPDREYSKSFQDLFKK